MDLLVEIALSAFSDPYISNSGNGGVPLILVEMVCLLLERMELSSGFSQIERKMHRTHTSRQTLLPSRAIIKQIEQAKD